MALRIKKSIDGRVHVSEMKDGDIAEIVEWTVGRYTGRIVQRYGDVLITLGMDENESFEDVLKGKDLSNNSCLVRILPKGTEFILD